MRSSGAIVITPDIPGVKRWIASRYARRDDGGGYDVLLRPSRENSTLHAIHAVSRFIARETNISAESTAAVRK